MLSEASVVNEKPVGVAPVKPKFHQPKLEKNVAMDYIPDEAKRKLHDAATDDDGGPPEKAAKLSRKERKKLFAGQNKNRPRPTSFARDKKPCPSIKCVTVDDEWVDCRYTGCAFLHDVKKYMDMKPSDIDDRCHVFYERGFCPSGLACRYGQCHIRETDGKNLINKDLQGKYKTEKNGIPEHLINSLRKRKHDFSKCEEVLKLYQENKDSFVDSARDADVKRVPWKSKPLYLAPLTTVGNLPFRRICKEFGADITCGEMALAKSLLNGRPDEWVLTKRHPTEDFFGVQICGSTANVLTKCVQVLVENLELDFIDLNMGCPIDAIYAQGAGSGLMRRKNVVEQVVRTSKRIVGPSFPITLKMRTGLTSEKRIAHELISSAKEWGVDMITLHGRSRTQRYKNNADWDYIEECALKADPLPVFGNGDVLSFEDAPVKRFYGSEPSATSGMMIGRGALIKPWLFREIKEQRHWDISAQERLDIVKKYANYGLEHWGSDDQGVDRTRRFLLEWLSFLHRYIPVGLLEVLPQKINERPPPYFGRSDLETLLSSPLCSDWVCFFSGASEEKKSKMAKVHVSNVTVLDNPSPFVNPLQFQVTFDCIEDLPEDLEWKLIYVGSAESENYDQVLDTVYVGPVPEGRHMFVFQADAPDTGKIPAEDIVGVTVILLTCSYNGQEFVRVGYYVNNEYADAELKENPPAVICFDKLQRNILASDPRVTRFKINWGPSKDAERVGAESSSKDSTSASLKGGIVSCEVPLMEDDDDDEEDTPFLPRERMDRVIECSQMEEGQLTPGCKFVDESGQIKARFSKDDCISMEQ
ncbi:unnamed protein product [Notodromas monacha]|uniref:tRNA-dihydrouridine(47) synthase [NAD(P)(+)] n=1 Tax=Notodromas monacha TaxID=399045 RepID=A0A7R9BX21_9CRUS|nr:unnamed protein product [Notodromas monacha]CAG0922968.1 unnamed protein product [Notodromas monacha]